ncbi:hypothetical protein V6000_009922 [Aspergillus fumigatus]
MEKMQTATVPVDPGAQSGEGKIYGGGTVIKPSLKQGFSGHGPDEESRICWLQLALAGYYQSERPGQCDT